MCLSCLYDVETHGEGIKHNVLAVRGGTNIDTLCVNCEPG